MAASRRAVDHRLGKPLPQRRGFGAAREAKAEPYRTAPTGTRPDVRACQPRDVAGRRGDTCGRPPRGTAGNARGSGGHGAGHGAFGAYFEKLCDAQRRREADGCSFKRVCRPHAWPVRRRIRCRPCRLRLRLSASLRSQRLPAARRGCSDPCSAKTTLGRPADG